MNLTGDKRQKTLASSCVMMMIVLAFALKSVLPAGFMPVINKDGFTQIVICSGMGEKTITVPADENPSSDHKEDQASKICAYQVLASGKILLSPPAFTLPAPVVSRSPIKLFNDQSPHTTTILSFAARGPPSA